MYSNAGRNLSPFDRALGQFDRALRTLAPAGANQPRASARPLPQPPLTPPAAELSEAERRESAALMRVNHCGEVCAQALYQGQSLTARLTYTRHELERAADEEIDHLAWCESRLQALGGHTSWLNPLWYGLSFSLGAAAGAIGDKVSLGFVAATEELVARHLEGHLERLPAGDSESRAVVKAMLADERTHGATALNAGGRHLPKPVKTMMQTVAKVMTGSSYYV